MANTVASLFYYLRWLAPVFQPSPEGHDLAVLATAGHWPATAAYTAGAAALLLGVVAGIALPLAVGPG